MSKQRDFPDSEGSGKSSGSRDLKEEESLSRAGRAWGLQKEKRPIGRNGLFVAKAEEEVWCLPET